MVHVTAFPILPRRETFATTLIPALAHPLTACSVITTFSALSHTDFGVSFIFQVLCLLKLLHCSTSASVHLKPSPLIKAHAATPRYYSACRARPLNYRLQLGHQINAPLVCYDALVDLDFDEGVTINLRTALAFWNNTLVQFVHATIKTEEVILTMRRR